MFFNVYYIIIIAIISGSRSCQNIVVVKLLAYASDRVFLIAVRARSVKLRQDSSEGGLYFVALKGRGIEDLRSAKMMPLKALSIQALSPRKILILDSVGDLHLLHLASSANGSDFSYNIRPLPHLMKVQTLTSVPDTSISMLVRILCSICFFSLLPFQRILLVFSHSIRCLKERKNILEGWPKLFVQV